MVAPIVMRSLTIALLLLGYCVSSFSSEMGSGGPTGAVCLAAFPVDREVTPHAMELRALTATTTFGFRFGKYQTALLKQGQSIAVSHLPLNNKMRVSVLMDGKPA